MRERFECYRCVEQAGGKRPFKTATIRECQGLMSGAFEWEMGCSRCEAWMGGDTYDGLRTLWLNKTRKVRTLIDINHALQEDFS